MHNISLYPLEGSISIVRIYADLRVNVETSELIGANYTLH